MTPRSFSVVIDCADPKKLAQFWAPALGYTDIDWPHEPYSVLLSEGDAGPRLLLQRVDEAKQVKNRVHIDVYATDIEAEAKRLEELGAERVSAEPMEEHGTSWIVMNDPEGNEFCVCDSG